MAQYQYKLTLINKDWFDDFLTFIFPVLPSVGDLIEVEEDRTVFVVTERCFKPSVKNGFIHVILWGHIENGENMPQAEWERRRERILDQQEGIIRNSDGMIE